MTLAPAGRPATMHRTLQRALSQRTALPFPTGPCLSSHAHVSDSVFWY